MTLSVITERIRKAIDAGELGAIVEAANFQPIRTMRDLTRNWNDFFPGVKFPAPDEGSEELRSYRRSRSVQANPKFKPVPRRSARPVPPPRALAPGPKVVHPDLFRSIAAVWEWYQRSKLAGPEVLEHPFDFNGIHKFFDPIWKPEHGLGYWPMWCEVENLGSDCAIEDLPGISLRLPFLDANEYGGIIEAFLNGPHGLEWLMSHYLKEQEWELPKKDRELIEAYGWMKLLDSYFKDPGKKTYPVLGLENWEEVFFAGVKRMYPQRYDRGFELVSYDWPETDILITSPEDIDYVRCFHEAFWELERAFPDFEKFEYNEEGITEEFAHEICNGWRRWNGERQVRWTSPKREAKPKRQKARMAA